MRRIALGGASLALIVTTAACGPAASNGDHLAAAGLSDGQLLLTKEGSAVLYSAARGERSLGNVYPWDLSPDGSNVLAVHSQAEPTGITRNTELVAIDTSSGAEHVIVRAGDRETLGPAEWSPDGSRFAYRLTTYGVDPSEIHPRGRSSDTVCVWDVSASEGRCFGEHREVLDIDWYPDGSSLLIAGGWKDEPVFRLDVDTGATAVAIPPGGDEALRGELDRLGYGRPRQFVAPQVSSSGRYIAALVMLEGGSELYVPAVLGSAGEFVSLAMPSGEFPDAFAWAPNRDLLAYTVGEAPYAITELYVHDPEAANDRFLSSTEDEGPGIPRIDGLAWSPDERWIVLSRPKGIRVVDVEGEGPARELDVRGTIVDWSPEQPSATANPSPSPMASSSAGRSDKESAEYVGFQPESRLENGEIVMPLTFVDGSSAEVVAPPDLGVQDMSAAIYTSAGLGGVDRTINFRYGDARGFVHEGPLETYEGYDGESVEVWKGPPGYWECPNLVFRFDDWFVGVRTCQLELSTSEKETWARSLRGQVTDDGFLILSATEPLQLQQTGGHEGPELILGRDHTNGIELEPGECDPAKLPDEGDIRTMEDGTRVSFSRIGGAESKIDHNWYATWCEDGLMRVQVSYAYEDFAVASAESFRMREIVLAK